MKNEVILVISDLHAPYHHRDSLKFLEAIKKKYKPTAVWNVGDEVDYHAISYHDSDPDLPSAGDELKKAKKFIKKLESLFPEMILVDSNHGSLVYRKAKTNGIPKSVFKSYKEILGVKSWEWKNYHKYKLCNGQEVYMIHGFKKNGLALCKEMGMSTIQGHYHSEFSIGYTSNPNNLNWSLMVGCLIDDKSLAFSYNKVIPTRPIIGCGIIINGQPQLIPMVLDKNGRWDNIC